MTQQNDFFSSSQQQGGSGQEQIVILNEPAANQPKKRVFVYDGQYFEDPGPEYSVEDVLGFLASTYPELENGTWNRRPMPDGTEEITFVKVTGEKGVDVTPHLIADRLAAGTTPTRLQAIQVLRQLTAAEEEGELTVAYLLDAEPRLETALHQAEQVAQASQRMVARCLALSPVPLPRVPLGF
jgi:PRTRC genetic system protein C